MNERVRVGEFAPCSALIMQYILFHFFNKGKSCREIKEAFAHAPDGMYQVQPESGPCLLAYCDMTSFGGGWTMCYSADDRVNPRTEVTYDKNLPYGTNGYRTDCNNIQVITMTFSLSGFPVLLVNYQFLFLFQISTFGTPLHTGTLHLILVGFQL